jgi:uncharacterized surface protein with fasciclin (FAS1) repeats
MNTLGGSGQFTVFAPTNAAFAAAGITLEQVGSQDVAELTNILLYHVAHGRLDSSQVLGAQRIHTLNGGFIFQASGVLTDNQNRTANIIRRDIGAANGMIHVIDQVLFP